MEPLLTTEDVAEWLRMDVVTVRRLVTRGELPAYRVGGEYRFRRVDLEACLEQKRVPAGEGSRLGKLTERARRLVPSAQEKDRFDQFTDRARKVLVLAQEEARGLGHDYIGTEHLLLGLVHEGEGVAAKVLSNLGVELAKVRSAVELIIGRGDHEVAGEICLTPRVKKVLELAVDEARRLGHDFIGTEHLLLGLIREGEGVAARVLESLGANLEKVRTDTTRVLGEKV